jgi:hypothetical protein
VFIKGRYIIESVVTAHEIIHSVHQSEEPGVVLKLDYEKAYDKVNWNFLLDVLRKRGFGQKWLAWMEKFWHNGSVGCIVNNKEGVSFETGKGLRQGDPLSAILFNLVVDVLTRMLQKAANDGLIKGLASDVIDHGVISLQYADDTIIFLKSDEDSL